MDVNVACGFGETVLGTEQVAAPYYTSAVCCYINIYVVCSCCSLLSL